MSKSKMSICLLVAIIICNHSFGQLVQPPLPGSNVYKEYADKTLVVALLDELPLMDGIVDGIVKKAGQEKVAKVIWRSEDTKQFTKNYNDLLRKTVDKYWKLNSKIIYMTYAEAMNLPAKVSKDYVFLSTYYNPDYSYVKNAMVDGLNQLRFGKQMFQQDYIVHSVSYLSRMNDPLLLRVTEADMITTVSIIQNWIISNTENKEKKDFQAYCKMMAKKNCDKLVSKTLLVDKNYEGDEVTGCIPIQIADTDKINSSVINNEKGKVVLLAVPYYIGTSLINTSIIFYKLIMDLETYEIVGFYIQNGSESGSVFKQNEMDKLCNCK